jgi:AraC-like DNA-binding protein
MQLSLNAVLSLAALFQLLFVTIFLLSSTKGKKISNRLLGFFFLLLSINIADIVFWLFGIGDQFATFMLITDVNLFALGPLIFLYTKSVIYKDFKLDWKNGRHFGIWLFLLVLFSLSVLSNLDQSEVVQNNIQTYNLPSYFQLIVLFLYIHLVVYGLLSFRELSVYRQIIKNQFAAINKINLNWLSFMLKCFAVLGLISFMHTLVNSSFSTQYLDITLGILVIFEFYFINAVLFKALKQPEVFSGISLNAKVKYADTSLSDNELKTHTNALKLLLSEEQLFLNPELNVEMLAWKLNLHAKKLSQVINRSFDKKFFDLINEYRIEYAKGKLKSDSKKTILEILYESGFNSKSSFNSAFKKITGTTPTNFRNRINS